MSGNGANEQTRPVIERVTSLEQSIDLDNAVESMARIGLGGARIPENSQIQQEISSDCFESCPSCNCFADEPHHKDCPKLLSILGFQPPSSRYRGHWTKPPPVRQHNALRATVDPLERLPPEIASKILVWAAEDPGDDVAESGHLPFQVHTRPLELAAVCRLWRELAFSEPQIWTTLDIRGSSASKWVQPSGLLEEWLQRSGQLPLTIFLVVPLYVDTKLDERFEHCVKTLCMQSNRWRNLMLNVPLCTLQLIQYDSYQTPFLKSLYLDTSRAPDEPLPGPFGLGDLRPTHLAFVGEGPIYLPILWDHIVSLKLDGRSVAQLMDLLAFCPRIEYLHVSLSVWGDAGYAPMTSGSLILEHLRTMILESGDQQALEDLVARLTTPRLSKLSLQALFATVPISAAAVTALCARSQNYNLKSLAFHNCAVDEQELHELLEMSPSLTYLTLNDVPPTIRDRFFRRLLDIDLATRQFAFLPKLVSIDYCGPATFSWKLVADVAEARLNIPQRMEPESPPRLLEWYTVDTGDFSATDEEDIDVESLLRLMALAKGLSRENVYMRFNPRLLEKSLVNHQLPAPAHDVGLYYSLPYCIAMYGLS